PLLQPEWQAYRLVSSVFPPLSVFEDVLDPADLELAFAIEALTNDRLLDEAGVLQRVRPEDRVSGPGSSPVMAAFTHIGAANRFSDGSYGIYYCASRDRKSTRLNSSHVQITYAVFFMIHNNIR